MLFIDIAKKYLAEDSENLADLTIRTYRFELNKIHAFAPDLSLEEITTDFVRRYRSHLKEIGNGESTINKALSVFRNFTNKLIIDDLISRNPFDRIKIHRIQARVSKPSRIEKPLPEISGTFEQASRKRARVFARLFVFMLYRTSLWRFEKP